MIKSGYVGDILNLLGYELVVHSRDFYAVDQNNQYIPLGKAEDHFRLATEINGKTTLIQFNDQQLRITNDNGESIRLTKDELTYEEKKKDSVYNQAFISMHNRVLNYYYNEQVDNDTETSTSVKIYGNDRMKKSISIKTSKGTKSEDIDYSIFEDLPGEKHIIRNYGSEGKMTGGSTYTETLLVPISEKIKEEFGNETITTTLQKLDEFIPGFCEYYSGINPLFNNLYNSTQNKRTI